MESDLTAIFPATLLTTISKLIEFVGGEADIFIDVLVGEENSLEDLLMAVSDNKLVDESSQVMVREDSTLSSALHYYKNPNLEPIFVVYQNMPAVDVGGNFLLKCYWNSKIIATFLREQTIISSVLHQSYSIRLVNGVRASYCTFCTTGWPWFSIFCTMYLQVHLYSIYRGCFAVCSCQSVVSTIC